MPSVLHPPSNEQMAFRCAQAGCATCLSNLLRLHRGLVVAVARQQYGGDLPYADLMQEGRIALWQAILHYDPERGIAFSTYAWQAIRRRIWSAVMRAERPQSYLMATAPPDPLACVETMTQYAAVQAALREVLRCLPGRLPEVLTLAYGLDGQAPLSLAALAREYGVTRECVRQWRNDALVLLRLPALSATLRRLCDRNDRRAYRQAEALNRAWLRQRRGGRR
jgi:RNA polymerase sigma factor (sigma-70 family)